VYGTSRYIEILTPQSESLLRECLVVDMRDNPASASKPYHARGPPLKVGSRMRT
jgi:hypothetical protein